ncbi:hypothetical protein B6S12_02795 [Helicobacter valdiviensis]|uniref:Pilus assembly protein PilO n=1 Tax=Helicobacter valdiviensis TaxID=1458358 RepID=A0A2W6MZ11_9HELI|nr:hypothetical protein [Helicobacter valdiviensis]PZT48588.1 hypothetical protein B6S12_02795 [Helicobacter valdiviensis]
MRAFFAQIDWIRNTFFFIFYFFLIAGLFIGVVMPSLKDFQENNANYRREIFVLKQINTQMENAQKALLSYQETHKTTLNAFKNKPTAQKIKQQLSSIFMQVDVVKDGEPTLENSYKVQKFIVSGRLKDINALYDSLSQISTLEGKLRFSFPIHIEEEKGELILSYRLNAYYQE